MCKSGEDVVGILYTLYTYSDLYKFSSRIRITAKRCGWGGEGGERVCVQLQFRVKKKKIENKNEIPLRCATPRAYIDDESCNIITRNGRFSILLYT